MGHYLIIRIDLKTGRLLRQVAKARGQDVSNFLRAVIKGELARLSYLTPEEKKALGVLEESPLAPEKGKRGK